MRSHAALLSALALAFFARVLAQLVQAVSPVGFLPEFDAFQSGALPYGVLLVSQVVLLGIALAVIARSKRSVPAAPAAVRTVLSLFGVAYLVLMLFRLWFGLTERYSGTWFDEPIPTIFHLVLACFVLVAAHNEWSREGAASDRSPMVEMAAVAIYPTVMVTTAAVFWALVDFDVPLAIAAYGSVAAATVVILALESVTPAVAEWRPGRSEIGNDIAFLAVVQVLIPAGIGIGLTLGVSALADGAGFRVDSVWPHAWPTAAQIVLMLLIGDGFRYWLHRLSHQPNVLWRLHAVHHSPDRLYSLNVARFHPFDKVLQYLFDALPFVVLGVDDRVLLGYFVVYAINGFFQHSNCYVKLGPLNWVVSGPELHRWHHSKVISESDSNFGNNLIIWDVLFGTRFLPADRTVGELGLLNRSYPSRFLEQMTSVFVPGLDKHPAESLGVVHQTDRSVGADR